jgi:hypothetical protein
MKSEISKNLYILHSLKSITDWKIWKWVYWILFCYAALIIIISFEDMIVAIRAKTFLEYPLGYDGCDYCYKTLKHKISCNIGDIIYILATLITLKTIDRLEYFIKFLILLSILSLTLLTPILNFISYYIFNLLT